MKTCVGFLLVLAFFGAAVAVDWDVETDLDRYIQATDDVYSWEEIDYWDYKEALGCDMYLINYTSQTWMTEDFSSRPVWWHYLVVALPVDFYHQDAGFLFIAGGSNHNRSIYLYAMFCSPPDEEDVYFNMTCDFAVNTGGVGMMLRLIPNQPIQFASDPTNRSRSEDSIIAYTWRKFMDDTELPSARILQFPMTKGGVRALDVVNEFTKTKYPESNVSRFIVGGGSKRGWVSWLMACTDKRVVMVAPMVMDALNTVENFMHHYQSLGGWSWVLQDYYEEEIFMFLGTPELDLLMQHVDPYAYRERLTIPKLIIVATGDEFFFPDDSHYYFDGLPEPKYMMLCENNNHGLPFAYERILRNIIAFFGSYLEGYPLPQLTWERDEDEFSGSVTLYTEEEPTFVEGWMADTILSPMGVWRRDFRLTTYENGTGEPQPVIWFPHEVSDEGENVYKIEFDQRDGDGWRGMFINAHFTSVKEDFDFDVTTEVNMIPDYLPFPPCEPQECQDAPLL